ncbi:MAG: hypothetical protein ACKO0M_06840 [Cyanobium sp.]
MSKGPPKDAIMPISLISATRMSEEEFRENSALGQSIQRLRLDASNLLISHENSQGLPFVYNRALESPDCNELAVFIHDDVWIDDIFFLDRIVEGLQLFDVFGVIGNRRCAPLQPSWAFPDRSLSWDHPENLIGGIAHGDFPFGTVRKYRDVKGKCALVDGVMIAAKRSRLKERGVCFDERFDFHFYDVDFCRSVTDAGLSLGTYPVSLTHQSVGNFDGEDWNQQYIEYSRKWTPKI